MKKVIAFGTFDIFHKGHESYLKQARKLGDFLAVVVARDKNVFEIKGKFPKNKELERLERIKKSNLADEAILGSLNDRYAAIKKYRPDVICLGYDQKADIEELQKKLLEFDLTDSQIVRLKGHNPSKYKSSLL